MTLTDNDWEQLETKIDALDERHAIGMAVRDLFVLGCYTHMNGEQEAGYKACNTALQAAGIDKHNKGLYLKILDNLDGNEAEFSARIQAHAEINGILPPWP